MKSYCAAVDRQADAWRDLFLTTDVETAVAATAVGLETLRSSLDSNEWRAVTESDGLRALRETAHQCPYTRRGFMKPRGYAGDPVLLDYIYGSAPPPDDTSAAGRNILRWMQTESEGFGCVRRRRDLFAQRIDELALARPKPRVTAIGCGHFREGQRSRAVLAGEIGEMIALDHDPLSLAVVDVEQTWCGVKPVLASVRDLVASKPSTGGVFDMDLIYAAGLYEYLAEPLATQLTVRLFSRLRPGGTLLIANFVQMMERGWMEALMHWWLIYRTDEQLAGLADEIDPRLMQARRLFRDPCRGIVYLELVRA